MTIGTSPRAAILQSLSDRGMQAQRVVVQQDPYFGWRVRVVSTYFENLAQMEREEAALHAVDRESLQWVELLTPAEEEWAGPMQEVAAESLPLWPEALARARSSPHVVFASDLDQDLPAPVTSVFYSLRGGVGRSTALAYTARILADRGRSVLCIDMDVEAPGLAALFGLEEHVGRTPEWCRSSTSSTKGSLQH